MPKIAIQLFTVRDYLEKDYYKTICDMKNIGYDGLEFPCGTMKDIRAIDLQKLMKDNNLLIAGIMFEYKELKNSFDEIVSYCKDSDCETVIIPGLYNNFASSKENYIEFANELSEIGRKLKEKKIQLLYHIHGDEFDVFEDKTGFDIFISNINIEYIKIEIDTYWVAWGKQNPLEFFEKYGNISPSIHFKDTISLSEMADTEVGNGCIDMYSIANYGLKYDANWFIVEQEQYSESSMISADICYKNLKSILDSISI